MLSFRPNGEVADTSPIGMAVMEMASAEDTGSLLALSRRRTNRQTIAFRDAADTVGLVEKHLASLFPSSRQGWLA